LRRCRRGAGSPDDQSDKQDPKRAANFHDMLASLLLWPRKGIGERWLS
jgi:hypothetical protein